VQHAIGSWKRAQTLDPNQRPENSLQPLNLTLDLEHAHVSGHLLLEDYDTCHDAYFATAGRSTGRGLSSFMRGCRSSEPRITAWT
jgi:hypothetical protein